MPVTLIVEDGSIVANANSYVSIAEAEGYFTNRPDATWTAATDDEKKTAMIRATDYLLQRFRGKWKGYRLGYVQTLDWPRQEVFPEAFYSDLDYEIPDDVIPQEVKDAQMILATRVIAGATLNADIGRLTSSEKVGSLEVKYFGHSFNRTQFVAATDRLDPLLIQFDGLQRT